MTAHHAVTVTHAHHSVTETTVQHVPAAETSVAVMTAHHAVTVTHAHHSVTATTAAVVLVRVETHVDATIAHHAVAMIAHAAHAPIPVADVLQAHAAPPADARSQHVVTSPLVQSARLDQ